jgi:hypothetical protein
VNDVVQALEARIDKLESELSTLRRAGDARSSTVPVSDRRHVVKLLAATAVGAVAGTAMKAGTAVAADGGPLVLGEPNTAETRTGLFCATDHALIVESGDGYGMIVDGTFGNQWFFASGGSPIGQPGDMGALWVDEAGQWWAATVTGGDGGWRMLAGPNSAGTLHLLPSPKRVYDSRPGEPPAIDPKSPLAPNLARTIDPTANSSGVPVQARGVLVTLTIVAPAAPGFATIWPDGQWPGSSNINFAAGQNIAVSTVVGLADGAFFQVLANVATDVIVDVVGYFI